MEWKEVTLGELGTIVGGATPSTKNPSFYDGNIPWLTPKDLSVNSNMYILRGARNITEVGFKSCSCKMLPKGSVLFSSRAPIGYVAIAANDMCTNQGFKSVIPNEETDSEFLYYLLKYNKNYIASQGSGTTFAEVSGKTMKDIEVVVPKEKEYQHRIASILSSLDRKIELNNKINADLEEMAQAIFKNWFVDFEPFKDGKFVDSELGMIPEGWKVGRLKDLLYLRKDSIKAANKGNLPYLPIDTIPMHCLVATDFKSNDEAKSSLQTFEQNDIVVGAMRVYFHRVILAPCKGITRTTCFVLSVKNENALAYSLMQCNQDEAISFAEKTSKGSTMPYAVWDGGYGEYKVVIPPSEVMKSFNDLLSNFFSKMNKNAIENSRLSLLRDTLLPRLMSGELEVPE